MKFDLAISYTWIYDIEFTQLIEKMFQENGLSTFLINRKNIDEITQFVKDGRISFKSYLDRASDEDDNFSELAQLLSESDCRIINEYQKIEQSIDKSVVQSKLIEAGILIPKTYILPPLEKVENLELQNSDLDKIGRPFIIKPAYYSGGSEGVIKNAESLEEIEASRKINPDDSYLVQQKIYPKLIDGHRAWFRVLWLFGSVIPLLWDDETLLYSRVNPVEMFPEITKDISEIMLKINSVAQLDYFSSEFALADDEQLYLIDYVNDQCDMRLKSKHVDGVPDEVVRSFVLEMIKFVKKL